MSRATMSLAPPAANGTIRRIGRVGQVWAEVAMETLAAKVSPAIRHAAPQFTIQRSGFMTLRGCLHDATILIPIVFHKALYSQVQSIKRSAGARQFEIKFFGEF